MAFAESLFLSPEFLSVELGFLFAASIAAYELFIGDFIWSREEEARRQSSSRRGRGVGDHGAGYEPLDGRQLYPARRDYDRSLSPGRGGRGARGAGVGVSTNPPRRGSGTEGIGNRDPGGERVEESYYASPGGRVSPGKGSTGDSTRRLFYKYILAALLSRFFLLPVETLCFSSPNFELTSLRILLRMCQTLPDVALASALGLLVIFCAQIAFAASPPLSPRSSENSLGDDDAEEADGAGEGKERDGENMEGYDGLLSIGKLHQLKEDPESENTNRLKKKLNLGRTLCLSLARCSRSILASKQTFPTWNVVLLISYMMLFFVALVVPLMPLHVYEISLWIMLAAVYSLLLVSLFYVGILLGKALRPGISRRKDVESLASRLMGTCALLTWIFSERVVCFSMVAHHAVGGESGMIIYRRDALQYAAAELLPVLILLMLMHRKRKKERQNDTVMIHSIMNNIFGSSGWLGASDTASLDNPVVASGLRDGSVGTAPAGTGGGLGNTRRFKTYGGTTRGDSFPPISGNRGGSHNITRIASSSADTGVASRSKQQFTNAHGNIGNMGNQESAKIVGVAKATYGAADSII